ncbi:hypothetical protein ['Santalum album' aster yellows phytoplasma]|uniref:Uncharacterized protein n=1 Tax='Santalum album' aster yellows phytoplasma TaxID=2831467 RepID=A0ABS5LLW4_9MOLU|nr:hypothetical protein ['Santalum album' aster yellows phytoplasma]MBS2994001.1 hypothetical protein ['Santalum album' aster yellows phytoplasma]
MARWACASDNNLAFFNMNSKNLSHSACPQGLGMFLPKKNDKDRRIPNLQEKINTVLLELGLVKQEEGKFLDIIDLKNKLNSLENKLER